MWIHKTQIWLITETERYDAIAQPSIAQPPIAQLASSQEALFKILVEVGTNKLDSACNAGLHIVYQMEGAHMSFGSVM